MNNLRVSPMLAKLLGTPEHRAAFEREKSVNMFLLGIEEAMGHQKISQSRLAEMLGKKSQAISRAMQGKQNLTIGTMVDIAVALGKTVDLKVVDLARIQVATESTASSYIATQLWNSNYLNDQQQKFSYAVDENFVHSEPCGVS